VKSHVLCLIAFVFAGVAFAQDTKFAPEEQQIPGPACLEVRGLWSAGLNSALPVF
jgi:hypothetical protein